MTKPKIKQRLKLFWIAFKSIFTGKVPIFYNKTPAILYSQRGVISSQILLNTPKNHIDDLIENYINRLAYELIMDIMKRGVVKIRREEDIKTNATIYYLSIPVFTGADQSDIFEYIRN